MSFEPFSKHHWHHFNKNYTLSTQHTTYKVKKKMYLYTSIANKIEYKNRSNDNNFKNVENIFITKFKSSQVLPNHFLIIVEACVKKK